MKIIWLLILHAIATQQSIKAYVDNEIDTEMDLVFATDSGSGQITMDSETLTLAGGTGIDFCW